MQMQHVQGSTCEFKDRSGVENADDLLGIINFAKIRCLHEKRSKTGAYLFRESDRQFDQTYFVTSQSDGGLLLIVPFACKVKIRSICVIAKYENPTPPRLMRLFINTKNVDFSLTKQQPAQEFSLSNVQGLQRIEVDTNKFDSVNKLMIHFLISTPQKMVVSYIQINGERCNIKGQPEQAYYAGSPISQKYRESIEANIPQEIKLSAGKRVADQQAKVFTKENFVEVFGQERIAELNIDWQVFQNGIFDDPPRRQSLDKINRFMMKGEDNSVKFNNLFLMIKNLKYAQQNVHIQRVDTISLNYFKMQLPQSQMYINKKTQGVQLGNIVRIKPDNEKQITYYVKTHENGRISKKSSAAKKLNPLELMDYKILQKIGVGCESHFFGRDIKNFYIATKDVNFEGQYFSFEQLQGNKKDLQFQNLEDLEDLEDLEGLEGFKNGMFCLNLLSFILQLTDLKTNSGNFGFVEKIDGWYIKIVDFRSAEEDFDIKQTLKNNEQIQKQKQVITNLLSTYKKIAKGTFENQFHNFNEIVDKSQEDVLEAIKNNIKENIQKEEIEDLETKLSSYKKAVKRNFDIFCKQLEIMKIDKFVENKEIEQ